MVLKIQTNSTSLDSSTGEDIILRENQLTRLLFRPELVNNAHDVKAAVRGCFIFQKKKKNDDWEDHKEFDLTKLKATEWIKLELKSGELLQLREALDMYYQIHQEYGISYGSNNFYIADSEIKAMVEKFTNDRDLFKALMDETKGEYITDSIKWVVQQDHAEEMLDKLQQISSKDLEKLNNLIGITNMKKLLETWEEHKENKDEEFWQRLFSENSWVLSQVFSSPVLFLDEKAYLGGKSIGNKGGKVVDFIYQNRITKDVSLIEIKTPKTQLLLSNQYRNKVYSIHPDLSGAIVQVLSYKDSIQKNYNSLSNDSDEDFSVFDPVCVVIAGTIGNEEKNKIQSFELYRKEMKNVIIITFDELFDRISLLLDLLNE
ncbi:Shedu immune nuclease family protein [Neobacillus niacini]|uniref:Shedu immune nuclease family protein n=1 Tax=Neobacillus niacini TaxID=86668 RepID=UPI00203D0E04|nr:Shedu immune nuclease family protein [Neobacillus niacini]MCM3692194.1 DUF4263 domain-containing protein [Neobacillus niacini]